MNRYLPLLLILLAMTQVTNAMHPFYDQNTLDRFKTAIDYPKLQARLPKSSPIFIEWHKDFDKIVVKGKTWKRMEDNAPAIVNNHHAQLGLTYVADNAHINVNIHVFSPGVDKNIFDFMLALMASTSLPTVPFKPVPDVAGDIYFAAPQLMDPNFDQASYTLLSNLVVHISTADLSISVRDFASHFIHNIQQKRTAAGAYSPLKLNASITEKNISVGDTFSINLSSSELSRLDTNIDLDSIDGKLELILRAKDHIKLKAILPGQHSLSIRFVDLKTLYSDVVEVSVDVVP